VTLPVVEIHYLRPPDRVQLFRQVVLEETLDHVVTFVDSVQLNGPLRAAGKTILEPGSPIVWFTFPGEWFDIGRFHLVDGRFTGFYANILTPVRMRRYRWHTTDLFLDVWVDTAGDVTLLDEEEFATAVSSGWIDDATAAKARECASSLVSAANLGEWPPRVVTEWPLSRALGATKTAPEGAS
jgi:predicted RNA-binding protein associated with RNAse of E/G family